MALELRSGQILLGLHLQRHWLGHLLVHRAVVVDADFAAEPELDFGVVGLGGQLDGRLALTVLLKDELLPGNRRVQRLQVAYDLNVTALAGGVKLRVVARGEFERGNGVLRLLGDGLDRARERISLG